MQPLPIFNEHKQVHTDTRYLNVLEIMNKLIWQLYNDNMISEEVANKVLKNLMKLKPQDRGKVLIQMQKTKRGFERFLKVLNR